MSYFLWIEDFENSPNVTANDVLGGIGLTENEYAKDKYQLKRQLKSQGIFVELSLQDGLAFIQHHLAKIDYVILDIDLIPYNEDDEINDCLKNLLDKFHDYQPEQNLKDECSKLKATAGYYLFTELLVEQGFPKQHILFCSNHGDTTLDAQNAFKLAKIELPKIYKKSDNEVRQWVKGSFENSYSRLRRGVIEGCKFLKSYVRKDDSNIQFRDFIKVENNWPAIEIPTTEIENYLDVVSGLLVLKEPDDKNIQYRLFLRTLVHEWEENIEANSLKKKHGNDLSNIHDIYTFAWLMKMTRNWVSHANLLEPLKPQFIAFLFLINMRAMFKLPKTIQPYEQILLSCISLSPPTSINSKNVEDYIRRAKEDIDGILTGLKLDQTGHFGEKINAIYRQNTGNPDAERQNYQQFLLQYFWVNQNKKSDLKNLTTASNDFLPTLARHIYRLSFPEA